MKKKQGKDGNPEHNPKRIKAKEKSTTLLDKKLNQLGIKSEKEGNKIVEYKNRS